MKPFRMSTKSALVLLLATTLATTLVLAAKPNAAASSTAPAVGAKDQKQAPISKRNAKSTPTAIATAKVDTKPQVADKKQGDVAIDSGSQASASNVEEYVQIKPEELSAAIQNDRELEAAIGLKPETGVAQKTERAAIVSTGAAAAGSGALPAASDLVVEHKSAVDDELNAHLAQDFLTQLESAYPPPQQMSAPRSYPMMKMPSRPYHSLSGGQVPRAPRPYGATGPRHYGSRAPSPYGSPMKAGPPMQGGGGYRGSRAPQPRPQSYMMPPVYMNGLRGKLSSLSPYGGGGASYSIQMGGGATSGGYGPIGGSRYLPRGAAAGYAAFREFVRAQANKYKQAGGALEQLAYGPQLPPMQPPAPPMPHPPMPYGGGGGGDSYQAPAKAHPPAPAYSGKGMGDSYEQGAPASYGGEQSGGKTRVTVAQAYIPHPIATGGGAGDYGSGAPASGGQSYGSGPAPSAPAPQYGPPAPQQYGQAPAQQYGSAGGQSYGSSSSSAPTPLNPVLAKLYGEHGSPPPQGKQEYSKDFGMVIHYPQATVYAEPMTMEQLHKLTGNGISQILERLQYQLASGAQRDESNTLKPNGKHHIGHGFTIHAKEFYAPGKSGYYVPTTAAVISSPSQGGGYGQQQSGQSYGAAPQQEQAYGASPPEAAAAPAPASADEGYGQAPAAADYQAPAAPAAGGYPGPASGPAPASASGGYQASAPASSGYQAPAASTYQAPASGYQAAAAPAAQLGSGYDRVKQAVAASQASGKYNEPAKAPSSGGNKYQQGGSGGYAAEPLSAITNMLGSELEALYKANGAFFGKHLDPEIHSQIQAYANKGSSKPLKYTEHNSKTPLTLQYPGGAPSGGQQYARPAGGARAPMQHGRGGRGPRRGHYGPMMSPAPAYGPRPPMRGNRYGPRPQQGGGGYGRPMPQQYQQQRPKGQQYQQQQQQQYGPQQQQYGGNNAVEHAVQQQVMQLLQDFKSGDDQYSGKQPMQIVNQGYPNKILQNQQQKYGQQQSYGGQQQQSYGSGRQQQSYGNGGQQQSYGSGGQQQQGQKYESGTLEIPQGPNDQIGELADLVESLKGALEGHKPEGAAEMTYNMSPAGGDYQRQPQASAPAPAPAPAVQAADQKYAPASAGKQAEDLRYVSNALGQAPSYAMQVPVANGDAPSSGSGGYDAAAPAGGQYQQQQAAPAAQPAGGQYGSAGPAPAAPTAPEQPAYGGQSAPASQGGAYGSTSQQQGPAPASSYDQAPAPAAAQSYGGRQHQQQSYSKPAPQQSYGGSEGSGAQPQSQEYHQQSEYASGSGSGSSSGYGQQQSGGHLSASEFASAVQQVASGASGESGYGSPSGSSSGGAQLSQPQEATAYLPEGSSQQHQPQQQQAYTTSEHSQVINHLVPTGSAQQSSAAGSYDGASGGAQSGSSSYNSAQSGGSPYGSSQSGSSASSYSASQSSGASSYGASDSASSSSAGQQPVNQISIAAPTESQYQSAQSLSSLLDSLPSEYQELLRQPSSAAMLDSIGSHPQESQTAPMSYAAYPSNATASGSSASSGHYQPHSLSASASSQTYQKVSPTASSSSSSVSHSSSSSVSAKSTGSSSAAAAASEKSASSSKN